MLQQYRKQSWEPKNISCSDAGIHGDEKTGPPAEKRHTFKEEEEPSVFYPTQHLSLQGFFIQIEKVRGRQLGNSRDKNNATFWKVASFSHWTAPVVKTKTSYVTMLLQVILSCLRITTGVFRDTVFTEKNCIMSSKYVINNLGQGVELGLCSKASSRTKRKGEKSLTQVFQTKWDGSGMKEFKCK